MDSCLLGCIQFPTAHTAANISSKIQQICKEWGITNKVAAVVIDNAPNMVAAIRQSHFRYIPCFAHTLNLIVQHSIQKIGNVIEKCKNIVQFFKHSSTGLAKLQEIQQQMNLPVLKLKQSVVTRWNSTYDMLVRLIKNKDPLISTLALLQAEEKLHLSSKEWVIISQAIDSLKLFYEITVEISAEKTVSLSKVFVLKTLMRETVEGFLLKCIEPEIREMNLELLQQINVRTRDQDNSQTELLAQATLLDPRFKKYGFGNNENTFKKTYNSILEKLNSMYVEEDCTSTFHNNEATPSSATEISIWDAFDEKVHHLAVTSNPKAAGIVELDKFIEEPLLKRTCDPLEWWNQRRVVYPRLYSFVLKRLCIPATSVPCERIFSKAGYVLTERRNRLTSSHLSMIMFLNHNA